MSEIGAALARELGPDRVAEDAATISAHQIDYWILAHLRQRQGRLDGAPACVVRPQSTAEVATTIRLAQRHGVAIVPYGGGSGVLGGAVPPAGAVVVDTRALPTLAGAVRIEELPTPAEPGWLAFLGRSMNTALNWLPGRTKLPIYQERRGQTAFDYFEARQALGGEMAVAIRDDGRGGILLSIAVPVASYKQVLGAILVSAPTDDLERRLRAV